MQIKKIFPAYFLMLFVSSFFFLINEELVEKGLLFDRDRILFRDFNFLGILESFIAFCLIMPLLEELSLRAFLTKNPKVLILGFSFFATILFFKIFENFYILNFWIYILISFSLGFILYIILMKVEFTLDFIYKNLILTSLLSSFFFAIFHIGLNYNSNSLGILMISVLPFFFSGLIFCNIRIRFGLIYSIVLHSAVNFTGWLLNII